MAGWLVDGMQDEAGKEDVVQDRGWWRGESTMCDVRSQSIIAKA